MTETPKTPLVALLLAVAMLFTLAMPAAAQQPVRQNGLVNVNVGDVTVQLPIAIAANVCNLAVGVLAQQRRAGDTDCEADVEALADADRNTTGGPVNQRGLVNVNLGDVTIQVPVAVAANVCDIAVGVLARQLRTGDNSCDAAALAEATGV